MTARRVSKIRLKQEITEVSEVAVVAISDERSPDLLVSC